MSRRETDFIKLLKLSWNGWPSHLCFSKKRENKRKKNGKVQKNCFINYIVVTNFSRPIHLVVLFPIRNTFKYLAVNVFFEI